MAGTGSTNATAATGTCVDASGDEKRLSVRDNLAVARAGGDEGLDGRPSTRQWPLIVILAALLAYGMFAPTGPSGDSAEYLALARQVASHGRVTFSDEEAAALRMSWPELRGRDGSQDLVHFWMFSLVASPLVAAADALDIDPHRAFALFNAMWLALVAIVVSRTWGHAWAVVFVASPIVWWVTHTQVEVFTYSTIAIASAWLWRWPGWSTMGFGLAATQNPPLAILALLPAVRAWWPGASSWRERGLALAGLGLAVLHPLYYLVHLGRVTPLVVDTQWHRPGWDVLTALVDTNVGLLWHAPVAAAVLLLAIAHPATPWPRRATLAASIAVLLPAFVQAENVNHGGTPSLSRYALWLIPLALMALPAGRDHLGHTEVWPSDRGVWRSVRTALATMTALATVVWTMAYFTPRVPDSHLAPTRLALWVWSTYPSLENPPTEIFAERLRHSEPAHTIAATPNCAKVLLTNAQWPSSCPRVPLTDACSAPDAICYANRTATGAYAFVRVARR